MDLPQIVVPELFFNCLMAGLTTAIFFQVLTMIGVWWRERAQRRAR